MVYCYKFKNRIEIARILASEMANTVNEYYADINFDIITAVPMRFSSKIKRGYDQVDVLCKRISTLIELPYIKLLKQVKAKKPQHKIAQAKLRFKNVAGIYEYCGKVNVKGKTILLVDDIVTTGATINECTKMLLKSGAKAVYCLSATING